MTLDSKKAVAEWIKTHEADQFLLKINIAFDFEF